MKILVLTKKLNDTYGIAVGLKESAGFMALALGVDGHDVVSQAVEDANSIDGAIHRKKPAVVVLEALWVTADKLAELCRLHPTVRFIVRIHSMVPFLALEGHAIGDIKAMDVLPGVAVVANNQTAADDLNNGLGLNLGYLPNVYLEPKMCPTREVGKRRSDTLNVSCFGAIRPFKNQLGQALAAMAVADSLGERLRFHVNGSRLEQKGEPVLKNLAAAFAGSDHELVVHAWKSHPKFLELVATMDAGLQVSFTESFNIVAADHVYCGVPLVVSTQIGWMNPKFAVSPTSQESIADALVLALQAGKRGADANRKHLDRYNRAAQQAWSVFLNAID